MPQPVEGLPDFSIGDLAIHFQNREVTVRGEPARLSPVEYRLLQILVRNAGHVVFEHALSIADLHPVRFRRLRAAKVLPSHRWSVADASAGGRWTCASTALRTVHD